VVTDIPRVFLHVEMDKDVHMLLEGTIMELILKLNVERNGKVRENSMDAVKQ